jgi:Lon protease-like protein
VSLRRIPLFPLPGVVLLPGTLLPLHIFEPRYRAMVSDALAGDRTIGMAMLKPGWESAREPLPVHAVGGAGEIVDSEKLPDGRYNIVLHGRFRYRILEEAPADPYRVARVEEMPAVAFTTKDETARVTLLAVQLFAEIARSMELSPLPEDSLPPERLASELAVRLRYTPAELQAMLETDALSARFGALLSRMIEWEKRIRFLAPFRPPDVDGTRN